MSMTVDHRNGTDSVTDNCLPNYVDIAAKMRYDVGYQMIRRRQNASKLYL